MIQSKSVFKIFTVPGSVTGSNEFDIFPFRPDFISSSGRDLSICEIDAPPFISAGSCISEDLGPFIDLSISIYSRRNW